MPSTIKAVCIFTFLLSLTLFGSLGAFSLTSSAVSSSSPKAAGVTDGFVFPASLQIAKIDAAPSCSTSGICPSTLVTAYDLGALQSGGVVGTGQTVVIVDACGDPSIANDLKTFDQQFSLPDPTLNVIYPQGTSVCKNSGWAQETALDVEWAHVVAPSATIDLLVAKSALNSNLYGSWNYAITNNLGSQISNSWGGPGACASSTQSLLSTASSKGITVLASAGDSGAWGLHTRQNSGQSPADCAQVLTVGGTHLVVNSVGQYVSESAWSGSGGGYVPKTTEPSYQSNSKINDLYRTLAKPDVAADADPYTGVWVYQPSLGWFVVGGTSVSCPLWAGFMADVNQARISHSLPTAGFINPVLYSTVYGVNGGSSLYASDFHDVTSGSNHWVAGVGWDAATGLGSFDGLNLASTLSNPSVV